MGGRASAVSSTGGTAAILWNASRRAHVLGWTRTAKVLKAINLALNGTLLPFQATVGRGVRLEHHGLGVVLHPNVTIGDGVQIWHNVTIAAETSPGSSHGVTVGEGAMIGAGAVIIGRGDSDLVIGPRARVGAGAVVTRDVPAGVTVVGNPARPIEGSRAAQG